MEEEREGKEEGEVDELRGEEEEAEWRKEGRRGEGGSGRRGGGGGDLRGRVGEEE